MPWSESLVRDKLLARCALSAVSLLELKTIVQKKATTWYSKILSCRRSFNVSIGLDEPPDPAGGPTRTSLCFLGYP